MALVNSNALVWLILLVTLVVATWRARNRAHDPLVATSYRFRANALISAGRDRSSFRYRR